MSTPPPLQPTNQPTLCRQGSALHLRMPRGALPTFSASLSEHACSRRETAISRPREGIRIRTGRRGGVYTIYHKNPSSLKIILENCKGRPRGTCQRVFTLKYGGRKMGVERCTYSLITFFLRSRGYLSFATRFAGTERTTTQKCYIQYVQSRNIERSIGFDVQETVTDNTAVHAKNYCYIRTSRSRHGEVPAQ